MIKKVTVQEALASQGLKQDDMKARWVGLIMALIGFVAPWIFRGEVPDLKLLEDWFISLLGFVINGGGAWLVTYVKTNYVSIMDHFEG